MGLCDIFINRGASVNESFPRTTNDANRMLLRNKYSIMANFPSPKVFSIDDHACVSLKESIRILAGQRGGFEFIWDAQKEKRNSNGLNGTEAARKLCTEI